MSKIIEHVVKSRSTSYLTKQISCLCIFSTDINTIDHKIFLTRPEPVERPPYPRSEGASRMLRASCYVWKNSIFYCFQNICEELNDEIYW